MTKVSLEFVDIVGTFSSSTSMLTINGVYAKSSRTNAQDERVLFAMLNILYWSEVGNVTFDRMEPSYSVFR